MSFQLFERADQIHNTSNAQVFCCACAGLYGHRAQGGRAPFSEYHSVYPGAVGHAEESAEVLRVLNTIESQKQPGGAGFSRRRLKEVLNGEKLLWADHCDYALMSRGLGQ